MNPFREDTKTGQTFETLSDLTWHCGKHELPGTQSAALVKRITDIGYEIERTTAHCHTCREETTHRRLKSLSIPNTTDNTQNYLGGP